MYVDKNLIYYVSYNLEDNEDGDEVVPYIEPYLIEEGVFQGKTVKDLVKMGIPGLRALIFVLNQYYTHAFDCANSIVYELMLEAQNIFDQCIEEEYPKYLCTLYELYSIMPEREQICDMYFYPDTDEEDEMVTLYDLIYRDDPDECHDYLLDVIHDITTMPEFIYVVESDVDYIQDGTAGTMGVVPGMKVAIVLKENQGTDKLDEGIVDEVLTKSMLHRRGIKVRLKDGKIGRVQKIFC